MRNLRLSRIVFAIAALAVVLVVEGCGSGSSGESTVPSKTNSEAQAPKASPIEAAKGKKGSVSHTNRHQPAKGSRRDRLNRDRSGNSPGAGTHGSKTHHTAVAALNERVQQLVSGGHHGGRVITSHKKIRQILKEIQQGSSGGGSEPGAGSSINRVIEQIVSHP